MGSVHTFLASWLNEQVKNGHEVMFTHQMSPHSRARNIIVEEFLKTDHDYLLMVDSDTVPQGDAMINLKNMMFKKHPVITGVTPILVRGEARTNIYRQVSDVENPPKIQSLPIEPFRVAGCGASFLCVHRDVFIKMPKPYFKAIEFDDGNLCSEDLYFCEQVSKLNIDIWCDPRIVCEHYKTLPIS